MKLKLQKCSFFKKHIQYLGHLISDEGIQPLPEKLESIAKMPTPKNAKQVKQFLGLVGYYRKFVPRFADISRILTKLTRKDQEFKWTPECDKCFHMLKDYLQEAPILRYPDPAASTHSTQTLQNMPTQVYSHNDRMTRITQLHTSVDFSEEANSTGQPSQRKHMQYTCW